MKKFLWIITLFILCVCCVFGFAACEEDNGENITTPDTPAHTHIYTETIVPPTCTEQGYILYKCECGDEYKDNYTDALIHDYEWSITQEPTETEDGINTGICKLCGDTVTKTIPALNHEHNYVETVIAPTCTEKGYTLYKCSCGNEYQNNYTNALGHNFVDEICARCGQYEHFIFYLLKDETYEVVSRTLKLPNEIILPSVYNNKSVTRIGNYAFSNCSSLTSITIPDSVTSIGDWAFYRCSSLTSITIPDRVTSIGSDAFYNCSSLTSVTIGNSVTSIGDYAFYRCNSLTSITIPNSVTSIGRSAFYDCSSLKSITIPDSVTSIGSSAFYDCSSLKSVTIGNGVTSIGDWAFYRCSSLTSINVGSNNQNYKSIDGNLYSKDGTTLIKYAIGKTATKFTIPDSVTSIGSDAFYECSSLTSIIIPNSVTSIGRHAFDGCSSLTSITIPNSVTSIGEGAFYNCSILTSINVDSNNENYKSIDGNLYSKDGKTFVLYAPGKIATEFTIPEGVTSIGSSAFSDCSSLTSITIPDSVTSIGDWAFYRCSSLTSITIPDSVTSIGYHAFEFCPCVNTYQDMCYVDKWLVIGDYFITNANIKDGVVGIADYAFSPSNLTSITIPDSLINIGYQAFYDCKSLTNVTFGENSQLKSIGEVAFADCDSLTSITIPNSVTDIGSGAFCVCSSLTSINVDENNENYKSIDGNLYSKGGEHIIQYAIGKTTTEFTIPDRVISIGNFAFCECSSLTSVIIPDSVTGIGEYAFDDCDNLTSVYYNGAVEDWLNISIGSGNTYLTNATLYYYSETEPIEDGNYWHYDSDGITPVIWVKEN